MVPSSSFAAFLTFNLISRRKGTKFPQSLPEAFLPSRIRQADNRTRADVNETMFARGTIIPIFGQLALFSTPELGCKLLNNRSLRGIREGRLRAIFKGEQRLWISNDHLTPALKKSNESCT